MILKKFRFVGVKARVGFRGHQIEKPFAVHHNHPIILNVIFLDQFPQPAARAVYFGFDRAGLDAGDLRDLFVAEALQVAQGDHLPELRRQRVDGAAYRGLPLLLEYSVLRGIAARAYLPFQGAVVRLDRRVQAVGRDARLLPAYGVDACVVCQPVHPALERRALLAAILAEVAIQLQEDILRRVAGVFGVAQHAEAIVVYGLFVCGDQALERVRVACDCRFD